MSPTSGVTLSAECNSKFEELKAGKYKYIIFKLSDDFKQIVVEEASNDGDYDNFRQKLIDSSITINGVAGPCPRYAIYFLEYQLSALEGKRSSVVFIAWSPDDAKPKPKMLYSSSKDAITKALNGLNIEMQANDPDHIELENVLARAKGKK